MTELYRRFLRDFDEVDETSNVEQSEVGTSIVTSHLHAMLSGFFDDPEKAMRVLSPLLEEEQGTPTGGFTSHWFGGGPQPGRTSSSRRIDEVIRTIDEGLAFGTSHVAKNPLAYLVDDPAPETVPEEWLSSLSEFSTEEDWEFVLPWNADDSEGE